MTRVNLILGLLLLYVGQAAAQVAFRIDERMAFPDLRVKISEDTSFPDIAVSIGEDVPFADFTVALTSSKSRADFIITQSRIADVTVNASASVAFADITVRYGERVPFANVKVKLKTSGTADYLVYSELSSIPVAELVVAILPAINWAMDYKFDKIPFYDGPSLGAQHGMQPMSGATSSLLEMLRGAKIYAQDSNGTYLGTVASAYDSESIFNEFGAYGSSFGANSIWNEHSAFGSEFGALSPFNDFCTTPPRIVKNGAVVGYLTVNKSVSGAVSPHLLKGLKDKMS